MVIGDTILMKTVYDAFKKIIESSQTDTIMIFYKVDNLDIICKFPYDKSANNEKFWEQMDQMYEYYDSIDSPNKSSLPILNCKFPLIASHIRNSSKLDISYGE